MLRLVSSVCAWPTACRLYRGAGHGQTHRKDQETPDVLNASSRNRYVSHRVDLGHVAPEPCSNTCHFAACANDAQDTPRASGGIRRPCKNARMNSSPFSFGLRPRATNITDTPTMKMMSNAQPSRNRCGHNTPISPRCNCIRYTSSHFWYPAGFHSGLSGRPVKRTHPRVPLGPEACSMQARSLR